MLFNILTLISLWIYHLYRNKICFSRHWKYLKNCKPRRFINGPISVQDRFFLSRQACFCKRGLIARPRKSRRRGRRRAAKTFWWKTTPYLRNRLLFGRPSHKYWKSGDRRETFRFPGVEASFKAKIYKWFTVWH